jgi:aminoglycoside phosphotransferase (APT) family kinase protein
MAFFVFLAIEEPLPEGRKFSLISTELKFLVCYTLFSMEVTVQLVQRLIARQFPQWKDLSIVPVATNGWDNCTFHLGHEMVVRMPSQAIYASQIEKEHQWLPILAPRLPLLIPKPLALGKPGEGYPWHWSIYEWIEGENAASGPVGDLVECARSLGQFLTALHRMDATDGPKAGPDNFYRGGDLRIYDGETRGALSSLNIDRKVATEIWEMALTSRWEGPPVWVHGDVSPGNLLVREGRLCAVIDFGQLAVGDPACDLAIAWTFFRGKSREVFRSILSLDENTWARARGWVLWKALITAAGVIHPHNYEAKNCWQILEDILSSSHC